MSAQDMSGLASVISSITSDPEMMSRLRSAISPDNVERDGTDQAVVPAAPMPSSFAEDRKRLIEALKPFLSQERREKADLMLNVISLIDSGVLDMIRKGVKR